APADRHVLHARDHGDREHVHGHPADSLADEGSGEPGPGTGRAVRGPGDGVAWSVGASTPGRDRAPRDGPRGQCGPTISVSRGLVSSVSPLTTGRPAACQPAVPPARL